MDSVDPPTPLDVRPLDPEEVAKRLNEIPGIVAVPYALPSAGSRQIVEFVVEGAATAAASLILVQGGKAAIDQARRLVDQWKTGGDDWRNEAGYR